MEALRAGDFERRVPVVSHDELGSLAVGFNRMAETLAEFRRSNLSQVLRAKETLEATIATLPDAVLVIDPEGRIVTLNPMARSVLQASGCRRGKLNRGIALSVDIALSLFMRRFVANPIRRHALSLAEPSWSRWRAAAGSSF